MIKVEAYGVLHTLLSTFHCVLFLVILVLTAVLLYDVVEGRPIYVDNPIPTQVAICSRYNIGKYGYAGDQRFVCACISRDLEKCYWIEGLGSKED